jgi:anthranilate phosphoribosyltransferase
VGVYSPRLVRPIAEALSSSARAAIRVGADGIDGCRRSNSSARWSTATFGGRSTRELGLDRCRVEDLAGGSPADNAALIRRVFEGEQSGRRSAILLNAAGAIAAGGHADDLLEGMELAREAIDSGAATTRLDELIAFSKATA